MFADEPIHADRRPIRLASSELDRFCENGFLHLPGVFGSTEVMSIRDACVTAANSGCAPTEHLEDGFRSWRALTTISAELAGFACDARLVGLAIQLLGYSIRLVGTQFICRDPHNGPRTIRTPERPGWHRDIHGMTRDLGRSAPLCAIKCAIWFTDAIELECGATRFLPKSNRLGLPKILAGHIDPPGWISPPARPGDITIFENRTAHAGGLNTSSRTLEVFMIQYGYRWLSGVTRHKHAGSILNNSSPFARQILEPDDCDHQGQYRAGSGIEVISAWADKWQLKPQNPAADA